MKHRKLEILAIKGCYIWILWGFPSSAINTIASTIKFLLQIPKFILIFPWQLVYQQRAYSANIKQDLIKVFGLKLWRFTMFRNTPTTLPMSEATESLWLASTGNWLTSWFRNERTFAEKLFDDL